MKTTEKRMAHVGSSSHKSIENIDGKEKTERGLLHISKVLSGGGLRCTSYERFVYVDDSNKKGGQYIYPGESYSNGVARVTFVRLGKVSSVLRLSTICDSHVHMVERW
jgi:hypothetical protein